MKVVTNYKWRHQTHAQKADATTRTHLDLGGVTRCGYRYTPNYCGKRSAWLQGESTVETITCQRCLELIELDTIAESHPEEMPGRAGGRLLMKFRTDSLKTQEEVAADAQTIQGAIQGYESGSRIPSGPMLVRLSNALGLREEDQERLFYAYGRDQMHRIIAQRVPNKVNTRIALLA